MGSVIKKRRKRMSKRSTASCFAARECSAGRPASKPALRSRGPSSLWTGHVHVVDPSPRSSVVFVAFRRIAVNST